MNKQDIIKSLLAIEAQAKVYAEGLIKLQKSSYLLRTELEGTFPSTRKSNAKTEENRLKVSQKFRGKINKKLLNNSS